MNQLLDENQFQKLMELVNYELQKENVPIHARPLRSLSKVCQKLGIGLPIGPLPNRPPQDQVFSGDDLSLRIFEWFDDLYGEKLEYDFSVWSLPVEISGDIYCLKCPLIVGKVFMVADPDEMGQEKRKLGENRLINVLDYVEGLTPKIAKRMSFKAKCYILDMFHFCYSFNDLSKTFKEKDLVAKGLADIEASSFHVFGRHFGLSKWSSLQAMEKILKAFLDGCGQKFERTHDLVFLTNTAESQGLPAIPKQDLQVIQCSPSIRYDEEKVSLNEALMALHISMRLCFHVLDFMKKNNSEKT